MTTLSRHRHFMLTSSLLSCSSCSLFSSCCLPPGSLTSGSGQSRMGIWYIKFHDAKWMIICDYTRQQVRDMVSANPWAEGHTHTAASCMELNEGGSWRGRERENLNDDKANTNMRATAPRQSSVFTVPRFMRSISLDSWLGNTCNVYICMYLCIVYKKLMLMIMC